MTARSCRHYRTLPMQRPASARSAGSSPRPAKPSMRRANPGASRTTVTKAACRPTWTCCPRKTPCFRTCASRATCSRAPSRSMWRWCAHSAAATRRPATDHPYSSRKNVMSKMEPEVIEAAVQIEAAAQLDARNKQKRKKLFIALGATVLAAGLGYGVYAYAYASHFVSTDNAYTAAETAQVTPAVSGIVREVLVADTHAVKQGQVLVLLDDVDSKLALAQAEAELGRAVRKVRGYVANDESLAAQIQARASEQSRAAAQVAAAQADLERARVDLG